MKWQFWAAVVIAFAIAFHALFPRYDVRAFGGTAITVDRWTAAISRPELAPVGAARRTPFSYRERISTAWRLLTTGAPPSDDRALSLLNDCTAKTSTTAAQLKSAVDALERHNVYLDDNGREISPVEKLRKLVGQE